MKKRAISLLVSILLLIVTTSYADTPLPCADTVFASATANLQSSKTTVFTCGLLDYANEIKITACQLQMKMYGAWETQCWLPVPSTIAYNTYAYGASIDYSPYITEAGTYRICFTADADGHSITRYSNERTFSN